MNIATQWMACLHPAKIAGN